MSAILEERRARVVLDRLPIVTYMVRLEAPSRAVFVSPQMESFFGFKLDEFVESPDFWERRMAPQDLPRFLAAFDELRETHGQMSVEYRVTARDGREVWVRDIGVVDRDDDGEFYVHGHLTDVTREKELERELAAERAQAEAFFRDSPMGMGITDSDGRYLRVNDALARMNGAAAGTTSAARSRSSPPTSRAGGAAPRARTRDRGAALPAGDRDRARRRAKLLPALVLPDRARGRRAVRAHRHRHHQAAARRGAVPAADRAAAARHVREHASARGEIDVREPADRGVVRLPGRGMARGSGALGLASSIRTISRR